MSELRQPWIGRKGVEIAFILLPPFVSLAFIIVFPSLFQDNDVIPEAWWVILILLVDVAHVYSTLYRTYFDKRAFSRFRRPLILIPVLGFVFGVFAYAYEPLLFWRLLAYLAVFHFIRQQYGFLRIYSRQERVSLWARRIDEFVVYYATLFPLIDWHLGRARHFSWFVDNDFVFADSDGLLMAATVLYWLSLIVWVARELVAFIRAGWINIPRLMILVGTIVSWYFGIVWYNGDMAFTLLNVVSHGVPYMALVWLYGRRERDAAGGAGGLMRQVFGEYGLVLFLGIIFFLAWFEEGLWDMTLWKEHVKIFSAFHFTDSRLSGGALVFVVPLLALPQVTHYVIDGFIWRRAGRKIQ